MDVIAGDPMTIARRAMAGMTTHSCPEISLAQRTSGYTIAILCTNGEHYRIFALNGQQLALTCTPSDKYSIGGC